MTDHISTANGSSVERPNTGGRASAVAPFLSLVSLLVRGPVRGAVSGGDLRKPFVID